MFSSMLFSEEFEDLLATDMDRREFLAYLGAAALTVLGVTGLLRTLTNPSLLHHKPSQRSTSGYGSGVYGGHQ